MFWLPLILAAIGTGLQVAGQQQAKNAAESATKAELARQEALRKKSRGEFAASLKAGGRDEADTQIQQGQQTRQADYNRAEAVPLGSSVASTLQTTPQTAVGEAGQKAAKGLASQQRAQFTGLSDWQLQQAIKNARAAQMQSIYGNMAAGSANVLPLELQDASHKGDTLGGIGKLLGAAGMVTGIGSALGGGVSASAAPVGTTFNSAGTAFAPGVNPYGVMFP